MIPYKKKEYYDCIDCTLSMMFESYGEDYRKMFIYGFGFHYLKRENILNNIVAATLVPVQDIIYNYTDLQYNIEFIKQENLEEYIMGRQKMSGILGIDLDAFYLPWNKYYKVMHRDHNILFDSYDEVNKTLDVYDVYLKPEMLKLDLELLRSSYKFSYYLTKKETKFQYDDKVKLEQLKDFLKETPEEREEKIQFFIQDIQNMVYFDYETKLVDASDFIFFFTDFIWCRVKALDYIRLLQEHSEHKNLDLIAEALQKSLPLWKKLRNMIAKNLILKENMCKKRIDKLAPGLIQTEKSLVAFIDDM